MTPHTSIAAELRLALAQAEEACARLLLRQMHGAAITHHDMQDHRTEILGALFEALDRAEAGLGLRLQMAMYPLAWTETGTTTAALARAHSDQQQFLVGLAERLAGE